MTNTGSTVVHSFQSRVAEHGLDLRKSAIEVLQVNIGSLCNLACVHCHVEAGPNRTEMMNQITAEAVIRFLTRHQISTLDITGGAPEMIPVFRYLVREGARAGAHVIDRCNLTVLFEPGQDDTADFLAAHGVEIIASLPCYSQDNVDRQRGRGVFGQSIEALQWLNRLGYGQPESRLRLNLVYNPVGAHLPPPQHTLEADYRQRLLTDFGIIFHQLYTITNMPIKRFAHTLERDGEHERYMALLQEHFNPQTVTNLMCRNTLSVGWTGELYDCDFNQMLDMPLQTGSGASRRTILDVSMDDVREREVQTASHCFGCTAGSGSSCQGAVA